MPSLSSEERAELRALRDFRQTVAFIDDDDSAVMRPWIDAHKMHDDAPYIGCPFCGDRFIERRVTDEMVDAALGASHGSLTLHDVGDSYYKELHGEIVRAALEAALNV